MPIRGGIPFYDLKDIGYKIVLVFGALIVIYGVLWLFAELGVIPAIIFAIFPHSSNFNWNIDNVCGIRL